MTAKIEKMTLEAVKRATEAEKKLEAQQSKSSAAAKAAQAAITKYTGSFNWQQLPKDAKAKVIALKGSVRICSKCRWQSGCYECDAQKALRYHLNKEAIEAKQIPVVQTGLRRGTAQSLEASKPSVPVCQETLRSSSRTAPEPHFEAAEPMKAHDCSVSV